MYLLRTCMMGILLLSSAVQANLIMVSQNPQVSAGFVTYRAAAALPTPHQPSGPLARNTFNSTDSIRAALQIALPGITAADFDNAGDSTIKERNDLLWQVAWISPLTVHVYTDTVSLCWDSAVAACDSGAIEVKPLVDAALASTLNPQALALATGNGILGALPGFESGTWTVRAFFDGTNLNDFFAQTTFTVPMPGVVWLLLSGLVGLFLRRLTLGQQKILNTPV